MESSGDFDEVSGRPQFLTVLCVLTFIGSSLFIIRNAFLYASAGNIATMISDATKNVKDSTARIDSVSAHHRQKQRIFVGNIMNSFSDMTTKEGLQKNAVETIISSIFTLLGAVLMWRLRRIGFYLYIFGTLIGLIAPVILFGASGNTIASGIFSQFIGLVFIALYALNYNSLRWTLRR